MSTSISGRERFARQDQAHVIYCVCTFVILAGLTVAAWHGIPHEARVLANATPPTRDHYRTRRAYSFNNLDHLILFHGQNRTTKYLQSADVLLLGNSRIQWGLSHEVCQRKFEQLGWSYYYLGFPYAEGGHFAKTLIQKFDLHPKVVIINAEYCFFRDNCTPCGEKVLHSSPFDARKTLIEESLTHAVQQTLHQVLPHVLPYLAGRYESVGYRSRRNGAWLLPRSYPWRHPMSYADGPKELGAWQKKPADTFKREMDRRGIQMILTWVPCADGSRRFAELYAKHLQVPLVAPTLDGLTSPDHGSHLDPVSAKRFAEAFFAELEVALNSKNP